MDQMMDEMKSIDVFKNILARWAAEDERSARCAAKWERHLARWAAEDERSARRKAKRKRQATAVSAAKRERQATALSADDEVQLVQTVGVVEPKGGTLTKPNPNPILTLNVT
jgi:hypothetical protein